MELIACVGNREIAKALGITERTVKSHLTRILAKLGLQARAEATVVALRYHGVLCSCAAAAPSYQGPMADGGAVAGELGRRPCQGGAGETVRHHTWREVHLHGQLQ